MKRICQWRNLKEAIAETEDISNWKELENIILRLQAEQCLFRGRTYGVDYTIKGSHIMHITETNYASNETFTQ